MVQLRSREFTLQSARPAVAGTGLTAVDRIYADSYTAPTEALGGSCGNVLLSLALLGHPVFPVVNLGDDDHGRFLFDEFEKAGCETRYVSRANTGSSPVIVEIVDTVNATHRFTSTCPQTFVRFPKWRSINHDHVWQAAETLKSVSIFYADRVSESIMLAMEEAKRAGALIFFEPASVDDELFTRAVRCATVIKLSDETAGKHIADDELDPETIIIRTHGVHGLTVSNGNVRRHFPSSFAPRVVDTCGSGDMVTTGLLDLVLKRWYHEGSWKVEDIFDGIQLGQRLAALNCGFTGARGLFLAAGARRVRAMLDRGIDESSTSYVTTLGRCSRD
ncbi:PfkB family carbohydrate kinase [Bradyrhizobium prioriisuperbiae]|uniref:PfkB family carbohydrate kinase n=1 Tax=Bradyrhizobium prioriisuperbiae TaxID=2854389 RepID=UPI0028E22CC4|nr:PfkB family carbohydrate kinase [Bradyrhizobium prioritasuperba]